MQKARLTRLFWLVVLAALLVGCGAMASPPTPTPFPTASPTLTPIPPTNTPLPTNTPAPTVTPVPTQSLSSIIETLAVVTQGSGVSEAAAYEKEKSGTHPIVILAPDDEVEDWNSSLPALWQVVNVSQTELVASVGYREVELNRIRYRVSGGGNVSVMRIRIDTVITLYEAQTGATIDTITFQGVEPIGFPSRLPYGTQYLFGEKASHETVIDWLKEFVEK